MQNLGDHLGDQSRDARIFRVKVEHTEDLAIKVDTLEHSQLGLASEVGKLKEAQEKMQQTTAWLAAKQLRGRSRV